MKQCDVSQNCFAWFHDSLEKHSLGYSTHDDSYVVSIDGGRETVARISKSKDQPVCVTVETEMYKEKDTDGRTGGQGE